jgi:hypothetical protein
MWIAVIALLTALTPTSRADEPKRPVAVHASPITQTPKIRYITHSSTADEETTLAYRRRLIEGGAERVNLFLPSVIVCDIPEKIDAASLLAHPEFSTIEAQVAAGARSSLPKPVHEVIRSYELAKAIAHTRAPAGFEPNDVIVTVPDDIVERSKRPASTPAAGRPAEVSRGINQNAEFLMGDVLVQLILPESTGPGENWTDEELRNAISGAASGALAFQQTFNYASMNFVFRTVERALTVFEPIDHNMDTDASWIEDVLAGIGFTDPDGMLMAVHHYNNDGRKRYRTDWVYTAFIADRTSLFRTRRARPATKPWVNSKRSRGFFNTRWDIPSGPSTSIRPLGCPAARAAAT